MRAVDSDYITDLTLLTFAPECDLRYNLQKIYFKLQNRLLRAFTKYHEP